MHIRLGIDSGGTKTRGILACEGADGSLTCHRATVGGTNHHGVPVSIVKEELRSLLARLCEDAGVLLSQVNEICFAGAGVDSCADEAMIRTVFIDLGHTGRLLVCSDGVAALAGANGRYLGGILISGTGSIAHGVDVAGRLVRVGGWGYRTDDLGSGYHIAGMGIQAVFEAHDGRGRATRISQAILEKVQAGSIPELVDYLYAPGRTPDQIASLARCVADLTMCDEVADSIMDAAAVELVRIVQALSGKMGTTCFTLGLHGGILENIADFRKRVMHKLSMALPDVLSHEPLHGADRGALLLLGMSDVESLV